jgi:CBS domain-containing protein
MSVSEVAGYESILEKGSMELLVEVRSRLSEQGAATIDNLKVVQGHEYVAQVLNAYIATLGIKFVIFDAGGALDGWVPASTFAAQLQPNPYTYDRLRAEILGIRTERVPADASVREVLDVMAEKHLDNIAVIDAEGAFQFMANRGDLLTELIGSALLSEVQPSS